MHGYGTQDVFYIMFPWWQFSCATMFLQYIFWGSLKYEIFCYKLNYYQGVSNLIGTENLL